MPLVSAVWAFMSLIVLLGGCRDQAGGGHSHGGHSHGGHSHGGHSHGGHDHGGHDHGSDAGHEEEAPRVALTRWTDELELFVEFEPLTVGKLSRFAAHFTRLNDYKPLTEGIVIVSLIQDGNGIRQRVDSAAAPGIFTPGLKPKRAGKGRLSFELITAESKQAFVFDEVMVYADEGAAAAAMETQTAGDEIALLKEQAWELDFGVEPVQRADIDEVIRCSGQIRAMQGDELVVSAKTGGIVLFNGREVFHGNVVKADQVLFSISGAGLTEDNIETAYVEAKAEYDKARADYDRAEQLRQKEILPQQDFDDVKVRLDLARIEYENIVANYSDGAQLIKSPTAAFVKDILVDEGEFVESGSPLVVLSKNKNLILEAEVSQRYFADLPLIRSANFSTAYDSTVYSIEEFNGRLLSYGKNTEEGNSFLPVFFEIDNTGNLLPGAFVEIFLKTRPLRDVLIIPRSAIMEEYENFYVYVQTGGESFEKRRLVLGVDNGKSVQVISGLAQDERIVTRGAYQVKLAAMASSIPSHGHSH